MLACALHCTEVAKLTINANRYIFPSQTLFLYIYIDIFSEFDILNTRQNSSRTLQQPLLDPLSPHFSLAGRLSP